MHLNIILPKIAITHDVSKNINFQTIFRGHTGFSQHLDVRVSLYYSALSYWFFIIMTCFRFVNKNVNMHIKFFSQQRTQNIIINYNPLPEPWRSGWHSCFVFWESLVHISTYRPSIQT